MGAWIEIYRGFMRIKKAESHPTMGAWIEISKEWSDLKKYIVAPHDGCVD